jgi:sortase A
VLTGHVSVADSRNLAVFSRLDAVAVGDTVEVYAGDAVYRYVVEDVRVVVPSAVRYLRSDHTSRVTLITCTRDLNDRLVVTGRLV